MKRLKKVTWNDVCVAMVAHAKNHPYAQIDENPINAVVVFNPKESKWKEGKYSLANRSYFISSVDKYWHGECLGRSLCAFCLDKNSTDNAGIRLDWYLGDWKIDYCYFCDKNGKAV